ncbi:MAG: DNA (cytosine-5-)-methyltransferase [Phascolarctobacterium sp.]|nr:MAG: DNA (cytosine-5-)-methyltransferase [Phascolarctobacterium sp.]
MKLLSLFDGSGGFPLAASMCGITPVMAAEIEPYPIAVTKSRFPKMCHLGDVSKINGAEIEPVDIITFGSPCQDLSVAGQRKGLKHEANGDAETTRSGLFMEAIRIIKEMRAKTNGIYPRYAIWENVPGAFSSNKGEDFRTVLDEFVKIAEPDAVMPCVPSGGWSYADSYSGSEWSLAYRVFDAQYWGVPQRRRRIYLVADFRGGRAAEILFEREGVRGHFAKGGTPGQGTAANVENGAGADDRTGKENCLTPFVVEQSPVYCLQGNGIDRALTAGCNGKGWTEDASYTLNTIDRPAVVYCMATGQANAEISRDKSPTLNCNHEQPIVLDRAYLNQGRNAKFDPQIYDDGTYPTLVARGPHAVNVRYIVRRLTPTECARLQGFPDKWGQPDKKEDFTDEEYQFWLNVRNTRAKINGKIVKEYSKEQMLKWYNALHSDSAEYKMWGNGIALPCALYVMQGIADEEV